MPPPLCQAIAARSVLVVAPVLLASLAQAQPAVPAAGSAAVAPVAAGMPQQTTLYTLETRCSRAGGPAVACTVQAVNEGDVTYYNHRIGQELISVRISENPVTMSRRDGLKGTWRPLQRAAALFSTNTICFDGRDVCVVNPNYLNSVREDRRNERLQGRDLVKLHFGADGRVDASCYDTGCAVDLR